MAVKNTLKEFAAVIAALEAATAALKAVAKTGGKPVKASKVVADEDDDEEDEDEDEDDEEDDESEEDEDEAEDDDETSRKKRTVANFGKFDNSWTAVVRWMGRTGEFNYKQVRKFLAAIGAKEAAESTVRAQLMFGRNEYEEHKAARLTKSEKRKIRELAGVSVSSDDE